MKIGLLADVRGDAHSLGAALELLRQEACDAVACLGSTVEGGAGDAEVLRDLEAAGALIVRSPHDVESLQAPAEADVAGLRLAHETPGASDDVLWTTGYPAPSNLRAMEILREHPGAHASGDLYAPIAYFLPSGGGVRRRLFLSAGTEPAPEGSMLLCPGSVATASASAGGGSVMTWDDATRSLAVVRFGPGGERAPARRHVILCYCEDMGERLPEADVLSRVDLRVRGNADQIAVEVATERPDLVLMDYHLAGSLSGLDAILALRASGDMPVPVLGIAPDPAESEGLKAVGAVGGLPFSYLKDALSRLILELTGLSSGDATATRP